MSNKEFIDLVAKMRKSQKDYFRTRRPDILQESKRLEKSVDNAINELRDGTSAGLFDEL